MHPVLQHLESFLGKTVGGWKDPAGETWPFHVLRFEGGPILNTVTYSTMGLSDTPLKCPNSGKQIRHELIFMARTAFGDRNVPALLHDIGLEAMSRGTPYLCGDVIGPRGKIFPDTELEAFFVYMPVYLPREFASCHVFGEDVGRIFAWLIPITHQEAHIVFEKGWNTLAKILEEADPDLLDLFRRSVSQKP
jgi:hypothetical protein